MQPTHCLNCSQLITRRSSKANNKKYCSINCRNQHNKAIKNQHRNVWQRNRSGAYSPGKIQYLICSKWYRKPACHVYQVHHVTAYEYKKTFQLDTTKGIIPEDTRTTLQEHNKSNAHIVVSKNLIAKGKNTRYKAGDHTLGTYQRTPDQLARLKAHAQSLPRKKRTL